MQRLRVHAPGDLRLEDRADPEPGPNDVVVRTMACGICGTDLIYRKAGSLTRDGEPLPLGHEASGIVASIGARVVGLRPGMRVILNPMARAMRTDGSPDCIIGNGAPEGAFGQSFLVADARLGEDLIEMPAGIDFEQAALTDPLGVALHAIRRGQAEPGHKVAIYGAGPIGLAAILWLRRLGIEDVVSIDLSAARLDRARQIGARATIDASSEDVAQRLASLHGPVRQQSLDLVGTDLFIDLAGGAGVIPAMIAMARIHARIVIVAVHHEPEPISLETVLLKELTITSAAGYPTELPEVVAALPELASQLAPFISHRFPFARIHDAFATAGTPESAKVMVTFG